MMKRIIVSLLLVCALLLSATAADRQTVYDDASILTAKEAEDAASLYETIYAECGLLCVLVTGYDLGAMEADLPQYAGDAVDMVLLAVDMQARHFDLYQYNGVSGESAFRISAGESDQILDAVLDDMTDGDYASAAMTFGELSKTCFINEQSFVPNSGGEDYRYTSYDTPKEWTLGDFLRALLLPLVIGMALGGVAVAVVYASYSKKERGTAYPLDEYSTLNLTAREDRFVNKTVAVTRIPDPPSSSGGGHGGGVGGGGGAHMGGRSF